MDGYVCTIMSALLVQINPKCNIHLKMMNFQMNFQMNLA